MRTPTRLMLAAALACPSAVFAQAAPPATTTQPASPVTQSPASQAPTTPPAPMTPAPAQAGIPAATPAPPAMPAPVSPEQRVQSEFEALDRDGDGRVSSSEHADAAKARFDAMDADRNYKVSAGELLSAPADASVAAQIAGTQRGAQPVDANDNGELSPEESRLEAEAEFRARDVNGDGNLSADEMKAGSGVTATRP